MTLVLPHIERLQPYALGEQPPETRETLKLNQNESPYPPSPLVVETLRAVGADALRCYPDAGYRRLREALAGTYGTKAEQVFCGNGSSEIISLAAKVFIGPGRAIAIPDPSFSLYHTIAAMIQATCISVPTRDDFSVDIERLQGSGAQVIVLINPNAPSGRLLPVDEIERLAAGFPGLIVIDEAYMDFAEPGASAIPLIGKYANVLVLRTFSKAYALCGARVGCCFGDEALIAALEKGKDIYNVNAIGAELALAALNDRVYMQRTTADIRRTRDRFAGELRRLGFDVVPSQANFVLCSPPSKGTNGARNIALSLKERNIYIRYYEHPRLVDKLRISIGTDEQMDRLCLELASLIPGNR